jgi:membrane-bound lytic murein transglycosylase D
MQQNRLRTFILTTFLLLGAACSANASDLSISPSISDSTYNPSDPATEVLGIEQLDVWQRIRNGFSIPDLDNPLVASQTDWYSKRPEYIGRTTTRASRYLFHVLQELEKRDMPTELALLPFIESAFNPEANSSAKASGMWQFIPSTGLNFNLKQNMFKDERRDVLASTDAALTYLQKLHGMFGDWQLALAAYNWGEGSVARAIKKNQAAGLPTDFNSLSPLMPAETRNYYPKLQAVKNIIAAPAQYGITLPKADNQPYFVTIGKTHDIDLKVAAQLAELPLDEFKSLNPQFNRPVITGSTTTKILLPQKNAEKFKNNLAHYDRPLSSWMAYTVDKRERIESVAARKLPKRPLSTSLPRLPIMP